MELNRRKILLIESVHDDTGGAANLPSDRVDVCRASSCDEAVRVAASSPPDVIVLDVSLDSSNVSLLLGELRAAGTASPILVLSPSGSVRTAVEAMRGGATEVLDGPVSPDRLLDVISSLSRESPKGAGFEKSTVHSSGKYLPLSRGDFGPITGDSSGMRELFQRVDQIAKRDTTVLITGESGTGKELFAREIHNRSTRRDNLFVAINCGAIPESLIESELFGHEKGAFTHAVERRIGHFELADGGTLFLDEIGELSLAVQVKLLRVLQEQEFHRVGSSKSVSVNVRVITATNRNLEDLVRAKQFRQDLLYRVNVINLHIPPLRERSGDIPRLISQCVEKLSPRYSGRKVSLSDEAMTVLSSYSWPGNVRQLENVVEGLLALAPNDVIAVTDLPPRVRDLSQPRDSTGSIHASGLAFDEAERLFETEMILKALRKANFVQTRAAALLGISRRILKYKMDKLNINERGEVVKPRIPEDS